MLNPKQKFTVPPDQEKQYLLGAIVANEFKSYFAGKEVPPVEKDEQGQPESGNPETPDDTQRVIIEKSPKTQILVIGNSFFGTSEYLRRASGNAVFFLNAVDWITQGEALIGIRTRNVAEHPIRELSEKTISVLRFINIFGVSALMIAVGLFIFYWRRREKKLYEAMISR